MSGEKKNSVTISMKKSRSTQRQRVVNAIRLAWASLDSHLDYAIEEEKQMCESCGTRKFHGKTTMEYAYIIHVLSEFL